MGYPVSKNNSCQFQFLGEMHALALFLDPFGEMWRCGLFRCTPDGDWETVAWFGDRRFIDGDQAPITDEYVMSFGSVANYLRHVFPLAEQQLTKLAQARKPDAADKVACGAYDLALDVVYDAVSGTFRFNKQPPLSHAR